MDDIIIKGRKYKGQNALDVDKDLEVMLMSWICYITNIKLSLYYTNFFLVIDESRDLPRGLIYGDETYMGKMEIQIQK